MVASLLATLCLFTVTQSASCIPAYTCFQQANHPADHYDSSYILSCNTDGSVTKTMHLGSLTCNGQQPSTQTTTTITQGDTNLQSGSGTINTNYLQGTNCPINQPSESCSDYMVLKHRGTDSYTENGATKPYLDIGDNCQNYIGSESTFTQYTSVAIPIGCVGPNWTGGSVEYYCDAQKWGYRYYDAPNCQGNLLEAQTDEFTVGTCDHFSETTHCGNDGSGTGCSTGGITLEFWSWYDLECCPIDGKRCYGSAMGSNSQGTPSPTAPTPRPTGSGLKGTSMPTEETPAPIASDVSGKLVFYGFLIVIGVIGNM